MKKRRAIKKLVKVRNMLRKQDKVIHSIINMRPWKQFELGQASQSLWEARSKLYSIELLLRNEIKKEQA